MNVVRNTWPIVLLSLFVSGVSLPGQTVDMNAQPPSALNRPSHAAQPLSDDPASGAADNNTQGVTKATSAQAAPTSTQVAHPHRSHHLRNIVIITVAVTVMVVVLASLDK